HDKDMAALGVLLVTMAAAMVAAAAAAAATARAPRPFFVFGDSLVDSGNNNYLATTARADSPPYGLDYPTHRATGRFSNGLNVPDIISEHLGAEPVLPYLSPHLDGHKLLGGANFASAGVGILNDTGIQFVSEHHPHTEAAALLRAVPKQGAAADRRAGDAAAGAERAGAHHARRQRLRQQLLPAALLRQVPPVRAPGLHPLPHRRVQDHPPAAPRPRRPPRPRHRLRAHRLRAGGARHAERQRRVRPGAAARRRALQPAAGADDQGPQRSVRRRRVRRRQRLPDAHGLHLRPGGVRLRHVQGGVLRPGPVQRRGAVHRHVQRLPRPLPLRLLGQLPPHREGQPHHRQPVHGRLPGLHAPTQPLHHPRHGRLTGYKK
uniref:GDSL esterase/lipase n=1 Tax=Aegilops tauschii subsp. strangulata TaxID=200361 RepID=A0A453KZB4_AEGTS